MKRCAIAVLAGTSLVAAGPSKVTNKKKSVQPDIVATVTPGDFSRKIEYDDNAIPTIRTRLKYTTVITLPKDEVIMDCVAGDKTHWDLTGPEANFSYVTPKVAGARTNLNLVTASGNVYSFIIVEGDGQPDLRVTVQAKNAAMLKSMTEKPKWVLASELDRAQEKIADAQRATDEAKTDAAKEIESVKGKAAEEIAAFRSGFPSSLKHDYHYKDKHQFGVRAMAHSDKFTYIWADPQEAPTLYARKDGKPALVNFQLAGGVYVVPGVLDEFYMAIGKHRLEVRREE